MKSIFTSKFKFAAIVTSLVLWVSISSCKKDDYDCDECLSAQSHLFEALQNYSCNVTSVNTAFSKVKDKCKNGKAKADALVSACQLGDTPAYDCN